MDVQVIIGGASALGLATLLVDRFVFGSSSKNTNGKDIHEIKADVKVIKTEVAGLKEKSEEHSQSLKDLSNKVYDIVCRR